MRWAIASLIGTAYVAASVALAKWSGTPVPRDGNPEWVNALLYAYCELAVAVMVWLWWTNPRRESQQSPE